MEAILAFSGTTGAGKLRGSLGVDEEREDVIEVEDEVDEEAWMLGTRLAFTFALCDVWHDAWMCRKL
jgi:hypothetical protein